MKYSKFQKDIHEICVHFINKELEPYGKTYDDIFPDPDWFTKYTMTEKEYEDWKQYCIKYLMDNYKLPKGMAEKEMAWFGLDYGLKIQ